MSWESANRASPTGVDLDDKGSLAGYVSATCILSVLSRLGRPAFHTDRRFIAPFLQTLRERVTTCSGHSFAFDMAEFCGFAFGHFLLVQMLACVRPQDNGRGAGGGG